MGVAVAFVLVGCATALMLPLCATEYSDGSLSDITDTTRTVKTGSGTLTLSIEKEDMNWKADNRQRELEQHQAENHQDASWSGS